MSKADNFGLLYYPNRLLRTKCKKLDVLRKDFLEDLTDRMLALMWARNGAGLAANQVGYDIALFVADIGQVGTIFINPEIRLGEEKVSTMEGCLSIPDVDGKLHCRRTTATITALNLQVEEFTMELMAREAIIVQHEMDHLNGLTLFERMGSAQRALKKNSYLKMMRRIKKMRKK
jgi:peptide deformylase